MNSMKNAIVTVALLIVGYGSYIVLKEPELGKFVDTQSSPPGEVALQPNSVADESEPLPQIEISVDIDTPELAQVAPPVANRQDTTEPSPPLLDDLTTHNPNVISQDEITAPALPDLAPAGSLSSPDIPKSLEPTLSSRESVALSGDGNVERAPTTIETSVVAEAPILDNHDVDIEPIPEARVNPFDLPLEVNRTAETVIPDEPDLQWDESTVSDRSLANDTLPQPEVELALGDYSTMWQGVQNNLKEGKLELALAELTPWLKQTRLPQEQRDQCLKLLDQLAGSVIYDRNHHLEEPYVVSAGETLEEIAQKFRVPHELLAKINGVAPPYALSTGESVKVLRGPFRCEISLFKSELTLYLGDHYSGRFPVTIGSDLPPEAAVYEVAEKSGGRDYFDRRLGRDVNKGDAENRYGHHWIGLRGEHITSGHSVGIHGRPSTFSNQDVGSISLAPRDAEDVFSILSVGSKVEIQP